MRRSPERSTTGPATRAGWWTLAGGAAALAVGPLLGFGLVGALLALAALGAGATAYRRGERSWVLWLGVGLAVGVLCGLAFTAGESPHTNTR